jgi:hypothetical protein
MYLLIAAVVIGSLVGFYYWRRYRGSSKSRRSKDVVEKVA